MKSLASVFRRYICRICTESMLYIWRQAHFTLRNQFPSCRANPRPHLIFRKQISKHMKIRIMQLVREVQLILSINFAIYGVFLSVRNIQTSVKVVFKFDEVVNFRKEIILICTFRFSDDEKKYGFSFLICLNTCSPYGNVKPLTKILQVCNFIGWRWPESLIWLVENCNHFLFEG